MRRQPLGSGPGPLVGTGYDDLGWNDMGYDVDPDPSGEPAHMVDLKPLLTGSVLAHNVEAEQAVEDSAVETAAETLIPVDAADSFAAEVPDVVHQPEDLADTVAAVHRTTVVSGKVVSGRVDHGGCRINKKKKNRQQSRL